jgi:uncharacterized membrane protein
VRQLRKAARVDQNSNTRLKSKVAATPGRAAITEVVALPVALHREAEEVIAAEAVVKASEEEGVAVAEVKEVDVVAVAGTEASTPMLRKVTRAMAAWSIRDHDADMLLAVHGAMVDDGSTVLCGYPLGGRIRVKIHLSTLMYFSHRLTCSS